MVFFIFTRCVNFSQRMRTNVFGTPKGLCRSFQIFENRLSCAVFAAVKPMRKDENLSRIFKTSPPQRRGKIHGTCFSRLLLPYGKSLLFNVRGLERQHVIYSEPRRREISQASLFSGISAASTCSISPFSIHSLRIKAPPFNFPKIVNSQSLQDCQPTKF